MLRSARSTPLSPPAGAAHRPVCSPSLPAGRRKSAGRFPYPSTQTRRADGCCVVRPACRQGSVPVAAFRHPRHLSASAVRRRISAGCSAQPPYMSGFHKAFLACEVRHQQFVHQVHQIGAGIFAHQSLLLLEAVDERS